MSFQRVIDSWKIRIGPHDPIPKLLARSTSETGFLQALAYLEGTSSTPGQIDNRILDERIRAKR